MKLRNILLLFLSAGLILAGSVLPNWFITLQDRTVSGQVSYAKVSEVHLEFSSKDSLSIRNKMSLLGGRTVSMEIPESLAALSQADILEITEKTVGKYQEAGLMPSNLPSITRNRVTCQPYLDYWDDSKTRSNIFWNVVVDLNDYASNLRLSLIVDDQTETVCSIIYGRAEGWYPEYDAITEDMLFADMENLCRVFLEGLGSEFSNYDPKTIVNGANASWTDGESGSQFSTRISWSDIIQGEIRLGFTVSRSGFTTYVY